MSYPKSCEYKGWMKEGGGNCFQSKHSINSPRERCDGPAGCVWKSQRSYNSTKSPSQSRTSPRCVWGKRSISPESVGTCYNRNTEKFDKTGWRKCNYPSNCVGKTNYGKKIYKKNKSDDEDCDILFIKKMKKLDDEEKNVLQFITNTKTLEIKKFLEKKENKNIFYKMYLKLKPKKMYNLCKNKNTKEYFGYLIELKKNFSKN